MYCWYLRPFFLAVAQADSVGEARRLVLEEIGGYDKTVPERQKAHEWVTNNTPDIWRGPNAEFVLTDSAELREVELQSDKRFKALRAAGMEDPK